MRKIREKVFETNSSSVHAMELVPSEYDEIDKPDYHYEECEVPFCEFGWSGSCDTWKEKLAYLVQMVWETIPYSEKQDPEASMWCTEGNELANAISILEKHEDYKRIKDLVCKHINASELKWYGEGYIDHQSYEDYDNLEDWLKSNNVGTSDYDIIQFIFGKSSIEITNDNI